MQPQHLIQEITASSQFQEWRKTHEQAFLAHLFTSDQHEWQVGYFDPKTKTITTFVYGDTIQVIPDCEYLKSNTPVEELVLTDSIQSPDSAHETAKQVLEEHYTQEHILKHFIILQSSNTRIYNITFFTRSFKTINVRIDALSGAVLEHSLAPLAEFDNHHK